MPRNKLGPLVKAAREARGWGRGKLASHIGVLEDGRTFDARGVINMEDGARRWDTMLVTRLVQVLAPELDPADAYFAAGVWPPDLGIDGYRKVLADASVDQDTDGRVRGSIRPCAAHLRRLRPLPAPSPITALPALAAAA